MSEVLDRPTALAVIPTTSLPTLIAADKTDILSKLHKELDGYTPDASTEAGRADIGSKAKKVGVAKQDFVRLAKTLKEDHQAIINAVNAELKVAETNCDAIRDAILAPREAYVQREKDRVAAHEAALREISVDRMVYETGQSSVWLSGRLDFLESYPARDWQEFGQKAADALATEIETVRRHLGAALQREADAAELERRRAEDAERERQEAIRAAAERDRRIAVEAAEAARLAAEAEAQRLIAEERAKAAAEQARVEREAWEADERAAKAERDRLEAIESARLDALAAEGRAAQAERDRLAAIAKAEADAAALAAKVEADRIAAAEQAERDRLAAIETERQRVASEQAAEAEATRKREANVAHKKRINGEVLDAMMQAMSDAHSGAAAEAEKIGKAIITAIAKGEIRHVSIAY